MNSEARRLLFVLDAFQQQYREEPTESLKEDIKNLEQQLKSFEHEYLKYLDLYYPKHSKDFQEQFN